ncbi:MAG: hypothetical protein PHD13_00565 [Methanocellales archaeon]|nr:hypothetical protein [Methanocellales archaeon]MDD3291451.1 hypothetical protein [Methanocellales archaeon]MDD5234659.1 hypothetical protein [Methanocellales archaeon]MDD5484988.1 hypothetical protein [Methanocellales archaeon]
MRKILAMSIVVILLCLVGLAIAQDQSKDLVNSALLNQEEYREIVHDLLTGKIDKPPGAKDYVPPANDELLPRPTPPVEQDRLIIDQKTLAKNNESEGTSGIPEAGISEMELNNLIEAAKADNFMDPVTKEIDVTKLQDFKTPVEEIVEKLKGNGFTDSEIIEILKKYDMGYYPETGATWMGGQPTLPADNSTLKFVTVEMPGYGRVTVREDMVVMDGDEIKIVANKDFQERGLITPIIERLPDITYVTVETPYGPLQVPEDTLEREGKEKITETHVEFMKQLEELKEMEKQRGESDTNRTSNVLAMQSTSTSEYQSMCPPESYKKITELYEEGWSEEEIAEELAFPLDIVTKYLKGEYVPSVYQEPSQEQSENVAPKKPDTEEPVEQLTEEEKAKVISIALDDPRVREEIGDKEYELGDVVLYWHEQVYKEEKTSWVYPCLHIYTGGKEQPGVTLVVLVDLEEERVISIGHNYRRVPLPTP